MVLLIDQCIDIMSTDCRLLDGSVSCVLSAGGDWRLDQVQSGDNKSSHPDKAARDLSFGSKTNNVTVPEIFV